jgi:hypothetical protein
MGLLTTSIGCAQEFVDPNALGRITGTVLSDEGQSMDRAKVCVSITRGTTTGSSLSTDCSLVTDHLGKFQIDHVKNGTYTLSALKHENGYDLTTTPGYEITVSDADPLHVVTIKLGPRSGNLTCLVSDKLTGKPLDPKPSFANRVNFVARGKSISSPLKGSVQVIVKGLITSNSKYTITAREEAYRFWSYRDPSDATRLTLRLASSERRVVKIEMEPLQKQ